MGFDWNRTTDNRSVEFFQFLEFPIDDHNFNIFSTQKLAVTKPENCPEADICDTHFAAEWLQACTKYVSIADWIKMCRIEVCKFPDDAETRDRKWNVVL